MGGLNFCASHFGNISARRGSALAELTAAQPRRKACALRRGIKINNLSWHEVPLAVEHPRDTGKPPGTPSGRRPRLEIRKSPVERLFPPSGRNSERRRWRMQRGISTAAVRERENSEAEA